MARILWFVVAPVVYLGSNARLTAVIFILGFVPGLLAGFFGSAVFNWVTSIIAYIAGFVVVSSTETAASVTTISFGGYLCGQIVRQFIGIF